MQNKLIKHKIIKPSPEQRVFFCGDVHGDFNALLCGLEKVSFQQGEDVLIFTGDLIDRGPDSAKMIEFATCTPGIHSVLGNHELMFVEAREDDFYRHLHTSAKYGGAWTDALPENALDELADLVKSCMSVAITVESPDYRIGVIHAEAPDDWGEINLATDDTIQTWLTSVKQFKDSIGSNPHVVSGVDAVVHGQSAFLQWQSCVD